MEEKDLQLSFTASALDKNIKMMQVPTAPDR